MVKGRIAEVGDTNINDKGYHYTKTEEGWRLTHHLIAEEKLGRVINTSQERVYFVDTDRTNLDPDNIEVRALRRSRQQRIEMLRDRIQMLQEELIFLESQ